MKIKDAVFVLDCVEAHGICIEAKATAKRSLEAFPKLKQEVLDLLKDINFMYDDCMMFRNVEHIFEKHLEEIEDG